MPPFQHRDDAYREKLHAVDFKPKIILYDFRPERIKEPDIIHAMTSKNRHVIEFDRINDLCKYLHARSIKYSLKFKSSYSRLFALQ